MMGWVRTSKILSAKFGGREYKIYFKLLGLKGKRSELQKSQLRKPKRTLKNLETITTSKMAF
jgi:hypothetical protein